MVATCAGCDYTWVALLLAHCRSCHRTFSRVSGFDRHRRHGTCLDPAGLKMHPDYRGVWRVGEDKDPYWVY